MTLHDNQGPLNHQDTRVFERELIFDEPVPGAHPAQPPSPDDARRTSFADDDQASTSNSHTASSYRIADVAHAAGVSVATVSNVLNHPHKVAAGTRQRVEQSIACLNYEPSREAIALRRGKTRRGREPALPEAHSTHGIGESTGESLNPSLRHPSEFPQSLGHGTRVMVKAENQTIGSGTVDVFMPDRSLVWVWMDAGGGRKLLDLTTDYLITEISGAGN